MNNTDTGDEMGGQSYSRLCRGQMDTSDEAFKEWYKPCLIEGITPIPLVVWREAVHRCEAQIKDWEEQWKKANFSAVQLRIEMEERERKAFEAGWNASDPDLRPRDEFFERAYRAFKEAQR